MVAAQGTLVVDGDGVVCEFAESILLGCDLGVDLGEFCGAALGIEEEVEAKIQRSGRAGGSGEGVLAVPAAGRRVVPHPGRVFAETAEGLDPLQHGRLLDVNAHHHRSVLEVFIQTLQGIVTTVCDDGDAFQTGLF